MDEDDLRFNNIIYETEGIPTFKCPHCGALNPKKGFLKEVDFPPAYPRFTTKMKMSLGEGECKFYELLSCIECETCGYLIPSLIQTLEELYE